MRFGRRALICVALGFVSTVAIAWIPGAWVFNGTFRSTFAARKSGLGESRFRPGLVYLLTRESGLGVRWLIVWTQRGADPDEWMPDASRQVPTPESALAAWDLQRFAAERTRYERGDGPPGMSAALFEARGWPCHALWCEHHKPEAGRALEARGAVVLSGGHRALPRTLAGESFQRTLPYRPIVFGLFVNTIVWTIPFTALLIAPGVVRLLRRRLKGACIACGYNLSGLPKDSACPECGAARA